MLRIFSTISLVWCLVCLPAQEAPASAYPSKPITMLTVFTPGGGSDTVHRLIEKYAKGIMPQPFVITYKTGAGGEFGWTELANAKPDGYFIGGVDLPHITLQPMVRKEGQPGYKTEQLVPIAGLLIDPNCIMVREDSPWKNLEEFMAHVKQNPGKVKAAIVGKLTGDHVFILQFEQATGLRFNTIPYSGGSKVGPALASGEVDCYFGSASGYFRMENTRCLAVGTAERYALTPDLPTLKEKGIDVVSVKSRGFAGPPGIPAEAVSYLETVIAAINKNSAYIEDMKKLGVMPIFQNAKEFSDSIGQVKKGSGDILRKLNYIK